ncbi:MAG: hypothetical protein AAFR12_21440 [Cyanobacteria bacterium J06626_6]
MHPNKIDSVMRKVAKVADELRQDLPDGYEGSYRTIPEHWDEQFLIEDGLKAYEDIRKDLEKWNEKFSDNSIDAVIREAISITKKHGIEEAKRRFVEECSKIENYATEVTVYIPLGGIQIDNQVQSPISLGNIELLHINDEVLGDIKTQSSAITKTMRHSSEEIEHFIEEDNRSLSENFLHKVCATYRIVAEPSKALEVANKETQKVLNLLRYAIPSLYNRSQLDIKVDIDSLVPNSTQKTIVLSPTFFGKQARRYHQNCYLDLKAIDILEALGVFEVSKILEKPRAELNGFEDVLLRGIHWFGKSQTHPDVENEFLNLTTCLEVFFTPPSGDPISNTIAESTALWIGQDLEERKRIKRRIKSLYAQRSKVSHGGSNSITKQDIADLRILARRVVTKMIERRSQIMEKRDISRWIEDQKLS